MTTAPDDRARVPALGAALVLAHAELRDRLDDLRDALASGAAPAAGSDLRLHCLGFCAALEEHHTGEDSSVFPALARRFPELEPVLSRLRSDHAVVSGVLHRVTALVDGAAQRSPTELVEHLDGLSAVLETHFRYEEKRLVDALDALGRPGG